jgi:hypothetical protein
MGERSKQNRGLFDDTDHDGTCAKDLTVSLIPSKEAIDDLL